MYKFRGIIIISICLKRQDMPLITTITHYENNNDMRETQLIKDTIKTMSSMYKEKDPSLSSINKEVFIKIHKFTNFNPNTISIRSLKNGISGNIDSKLKLSKVYGSNYMFEYLDPSIETKIYNITTKHLYSVCNEFSDFGWIGFHTINYLQQNMEKHIIFENKTFEMMSYFSFYYKMKVKFTDILEPIIVYTTSEDSTNWACLGCPSLNLPEFHKVSEKKYFDSEEIKSFVIIKENDMICNLITDDFEVNTFYMIFEPISIDAVVHEGEKMIVGFDFVPECIFRYNREKSPILFNKEKDFNEYLKYCSHDTNYRRDLTLPDIEILFNHPGTNRRMEWFAHDVKLEMIKVLSEKWHPQGKDCHRIIDKIYDHIVMHRD